MRTDCGATCPRMEGGLKASFEVRSSRVASGAQVRRMPQRRRRGCSGGHSAHVERERHEIARIV